MFDENKDELFFAAEDHPEENKETLAPWKIMIVDDEAEVHEITKMALSNFLYESRKLEFISAYSGIDAKNAILEHPDTVLILLDIVMEEDNTGLQIVEYIRENLKNKTVRIVLRTGQPGYAPEREVIINYDINDYKEKSELTAQKLFTSVVAAIRSYSDLLTIETSAKEKERIEGELQIARRIQSSSMPSNFPLFPEKKEFEIHALMLPAHEVGGDFFDIFLIDDENLCFLIGDVSGKGIGASLFMMQCKTLLRSEAMHNKTPDKTLGQVNTFLCTFQTNQLFATIFIGFLNLKTGELTYSNAGHNPPMLKKEDGSFDYMALPEGLPINLFTDSEYSSRSIKLSNGDIFFGYTDGITEALNKQEEFFGDKKLINTLNSSEFTKVEKITSHILEKVQKYAEEAQQSDDITIMTLKFLNQ